MRSYNDAAGERGKRKGIYSFDINHFIEIGPGKVLSGLVKRINREVKIDTINNQGDIENLKI